jgi:hypothetical protein
VSKPLLIAQIQATLESAMNWLYSLAFFSSYVAVVTSTTITDIQGPAFRSPLVGQTVHNVTGLVAAKVRGLSPQRYCLANLPTTRLPMASTWLANGYRTFAFPMA